MSGRCLLPTIVIMTTLLMGCGAPAVPAPTSTMIPQPTAIPASTIPPTVPVATAAPVTSTVPAEAIVSQVDTLIHRLEKVSHFSGSVLIAWDGTVIMSKGYGLADQEKKIPNTPQTKFRLASVTKQFTAMAILELQQQGKLNTRELICTYLTECPPAWKDITIHHLLTHTSGIPDFKYPLTATTAAQKLAPIKDSPLEFKPGEAWHYGDGNYIVLSLIIEHVSGTSYEAFLQDSILTPLKMENTGVDHGQSTLATGYTNMSAHSSDEGSNALGGEGLFSTVEDLYRWDQALYTEQLVSKDLLDSMFTPHTPVTDASGLGDLSYGYGWFVNTFSNHRVIKHGGQGAGISNEFDRFPDDKVTIIFLSNQDKVDHATVGVALAGIVFGTK